MSPAIRMVLAAMVAALAGGAQGADEWRYRTDAQLLYIGYSGSSTRQSLVDAGLFATVEYLDDGALVVGADRLQTTFKGTDPVTHLQLYLSGRWHLYPDYLPGRLSLRLDGFLLDNLDPASNVGEGSVVMPIVSFEEYAGSYAVEGGYARSEYKQGLSVGQTLLGGGFSPLADEWISVRVDLFSFSDPASAQGLSSSQGYDLRWTHWFDPDNALRLESGFIALRAGERLFAVDPDAASVANRNDILTEGGALGATWRMGEPAALMVLVGTQNFDDRSGGEKYNGLIAYLNFKYQW